MSDEAPTGSVLIVEDEFLIALDIEATLQELGCTRTYLAPDMDRALQLAERSPIRAALLDINLGGKRSFAVAAVLQDRNIPFVFLTGYDQQVVPANFAAIPVLKKPFTRDDLLKIARILDLP